MTLNRRKLALVVGIDEYDNFPPLRCSKNDANDMASALRSINFEVKLMITVDQAEMEHAIIDFRKLITRDDIVLFYFAGHGVQLEV